MAGTEGARGPFFSPDGQWVAFWAAGKLKKTPVGGGSPIALCDATDLLGGSWGDDGNIIATLDSTGRLFRVSSGGGTPVTVLDLTRESLAPRWPQVLPGAKAVLYTSIGTSGPDAGNIEVFGFQSGKRETLVRGGTYGRYLPGGHLIYINQGSLFALRFDLDRLQVRGRPVAVLRDVAYSPAFGFAQLDFSRGGMLLYRRAPGNGEFTMQWLDAHGNAAPLLYRPAHYEWLRLSPDGGRLAFVLMESGSTNIWISENQPGRLTPLTTGDSLHIDPVWTPDGHYIVFEGANGMWWVRADGSAKPQPLTRSSNAQVPWSITRDGKRLAFYEMSPTTAFDVWTLPLQFDEGVPRAGRPEPFLQTPYYEVYPTFSPDGRWIAYASNKSGAWEVYVRAFPDRGGEVQISNGGGRVPRWPFYGTDNQRIVAVAYTIHGDSFKAGKPRIWSDGRLGNTGVFPNFDVAPNGNRVAAMLPGVNDEERESNQAIFLLNFFDEVQRRLTNHGR